MINPDRLSDQKGVHLSLALARGWGAGTRELKRQHGWLWISLHLQGNNAGGVLAWRNAFGFELLIYNIDPDPAPGSQPGGLPVVQLRIDEIVERLRTADGVQLEYPRRIHRICLLAVVKDRVADQKLPIFFVDI